MAFPTLPYEPKIIETNREIVGSARAGITGTHFAQGKVFDFHVLITILVGAIRDNTIRREAHDPGSQRRADAQN